MGYLGKISAIVTANPVNLQQGLSNAAKSVRLFGQSVEKNLSSAMRDSDKSLSGILTASQKLQASLAAAASTRLKFKGFADLDADIASAIKRTTELANVSAAISTPLAAAARKFEGMSNAVQASFLPALVAAQQSVITLRNEINAGKTISDSYFSSIAKKASLAAQAIDRIAEATQLTNQSQVSKSLAFVDPATEDALQRIVALQKQASAAPLKLRMDQSFQAAQIDIERLANRLTVLTAAQESYNSRGKKVPTGLSDGMLRVRDSIDSALSSLSGLIQKEESSKTAALAAAKAQDLLVESMLATAAAANGPIADPFAARIKSVEQLRAALMSLPDSDPMKASGMQFVGEMGTRVGVEAAGVRAGTTTASQAGISAGNDVAAIEALSAAMEAEKTAAKTLAEEVLKVSTSFQAASQSAKSLTPDPFEAQTKAAIRYREAIMRLADSDPRKAAELSRLGSHASKMDLAAQRTASGALSPADAAGLAGRNAETMNRDADSLKDNGLGKSMDDASRQTDILKAKINSLKGQLDQLDDPIRSSIIPSIKAMENEFAVGTPEAIQASIANARQLEATIARVQKASTIRNSGSIIDDDKINVAMGRLSGLEQVLLQVGAEAGGPVAAAFDKVANSTRAAVAAGTMGLPTTIALLKQEEAAAIAAAVATERISAGSAMQKVQRAGDVGRTGMNKFAMGMNQAAFAVDDFFSSVGGIEQKVRAVSNNITQLGFVVGNTKGLFIALGAVVLTQVGLALYKFMNDGRSTEDVLKGMNDALSRQKSLLESLAQAYDNLAESIGKSGMSDRGQKEADRKKDFDDIRKKQKELRDESIQSLDPTINKERANQAMLQKKLENEPTVGGRVVLQQKIKESKEREKQRKIDLANSPTPTADASRNAVEAALNHAMYTGDASAEEIDAAKGRNKASAAAAIPQGATIEQQIAGLQKMQEQLRPQAESSLFGGPARQSIAELEAMKQGLLKTGSAIKDEGLVKILEGLDGVGKVLDAGQERLKKALGEDIGSSAIAAFMDQISKDLEVQTKLVTDNPGNKVIQAQAEATKAELEIVAKSLAGAAIYIELFSDVMKKISGTLQSDLGSMQQLADKAREDDIRLGTPATSRRRKEADQELKDSEKEKNRIENDLKYARKKAEELFIAQGPQALGMKQQIQSLDTTIADPKTSADDLRAALTKRDTLLERQNAAIEKDPAVIKAKADMNAASKAQQQREGAVRGLDVAKTGDEKRREDLKAKADDLAAASNKAGGQAGAALAQKGAEQMAIAAAPMLSGFADEVKNARLQGRSRQSLSVSDTTTSEGQKELNRLLRGDDASKDVNLVELQQQNKSLREIVDILKTDHNIIVDL